MKVQMYNEGLIEWWRNNPYLYILSFQVTRESKRFSKRRRIGSRVLIAPLMLLF